MSQPSGYGLNGKSIFENVAKPMVTNVQFTVTPTNGLGITSLKSNGYVRNVFMHTSTTPAANNGYTNPNPAAGYAVIQFNNNFNYYLNGLAQFQPPVTGSVKIDNSALTAGVPYVISTLGDASLAKWQSIGVPPGITPAVGVSFIALTNGGAGNVLTSRVSTTTSSGVFGVEVVGNPQVMLSSSNIASNGGAWMMVQFVGSTVSGTVSAPLLTMNSYTPAGTNDGGSPPIFTGTAATLTGTNSVPTFTSTSTDAVEAPATGTIVMLSFKYDGSTVTIDGL